MSDPTGAVPAEGTPAPESTESTGADYGPVMDRLEQLAGTVGELQTGFQTFAQQQAPEAEEEPDLWAQMFEQDQEQQIEPQAPQLDPQALRGAIQQAIQQSNAPLLARLQHFEMQQATQQLYAEIPQLADKPENVETRQQTAMAVQQMLQGAPPEAVQWAINNPRVFATVFKAAEAENAARAQVPAGGGVPSLEAAGGAHPGGDGTQTSPIDQIYGTRQAEIPKGFR